MICVKQEKYKQKIKKVGFLEVVIGLNRIKMEKEKMKEVLDWLTLKGIKNIQKFLRLANYYWQFIKDFPFIAKLLHDLVRKDWKWDQTQKQEKLFKKLKKKFIKKTSISSTRFK